MMARPGKPAGLMISPISSVLQSIYICLNAVLGVALLGADKAGRHLHAVGPFGQGMLQVGPVPDSSGSNDRHVCAVFAAEKLLDA